MANDICYRLFKNGKRISDHASPDEAKSGADCVCFLPNLRMTEWTGEDAHGNIWAVRQVPPGS